MNWMQKLDLLVKNLARRKQVDADLHDELAYHLHQETAANIARGMSPGDAFLAAKRATGSVALIEEQCRDQRSGFQLESLWRDLRYAFRYLRRSPVLTGAAVFTLALAIGANTAIFTVVNTVLFRPLPIANANRVVFFNEGGHVNMSFPNFRDFRARGGRELADAAAYRITPVSFSRTGGKSQRAWVYEATDNYFRMLGVKPHLGTFFADYGDKPGSQPAVVLSYRFWTGAMASDASIVGRGVKINGHVYQVLGVAPPSFIGTELLLSPDMWAPISMAAQIEPQFHWLESRKSAMIWVLGRLREGVSVARAEAGLNVVARQLAREYPEDNKGLTISLSRPGLIGSALRGPVVGFSSVLLAAAGVVVLLACVSLAGMLTARASDRRKEMAVRLSIGGGRTHILRQLFFEMLLLATAGAGTGLGFCVAICRMFRAWRLPVDVPVNTVLEPDWRVLLYTAGMALITVFLFGISPVLQAMRTDVVRELKGDATSGRSRRWTVRDFLVAGQIALSVMLVTSSVLVVRSLQHALTMPIGFSPDGAVSVSFDLALQGYSEQQGRAFTENLRRRLTSVPAFEAVGFSGFMPLRIGEENGRALHEGQLATEKNLGEQSEIFAVDPGYLRAMGTRLLYGRNVAESDRSGEPLVALVNQTFARRLFPDGNAVGRRFHFSDEPNLMQIIGIVEDGKYEHLGEDPLPAVFYPVAQHYNAWSTAIVRTQMPPSAGVAMIREVVKSMDPDMPVFNAGSLREELAFALFPARLAVAVLGAFGVLAVILAATGLFALVSYSVSRRKREIGIRMAVGARPSQVLASVAGRVALLCVVGLAVGLVLVFAGGGAMAALLYGVSPRDPMTYSVSVAILAVVAVIACAGPARRAIQIDPARILRSD